MARAPLSTGVTLTDQGTSTEPDVAQHIHQALVEYRETQQFSDFVVTVDEVEFKCHRVVLSARSGFFRSLLSSSMKETAEGKASLQRMSSDVFTVALKWMYEGDACLTTENVFEVLFAADLLDIECLMIACKHILTNILSLDNCVSIYHTSKYLNDVNLKWLSLNFLLKNFDRVCVSDHFYQLTAEDLKVLVSDPRLISRSEDAVVENILKWVRFGMNSSSSEEQSIEIFTDEEEEENSQGSGEKLPGTDESTVLSPFHEFNDAASSLHENNPNGCELHQRNGNPTKKLQPARKGDGFQRNKNLKRQKRKIRKLNQKHKQKSSLLDKSEAKKKQQRAEILADILNSTRYLLVSGNCLWQTLACDAMIQSDPRCQRIVKEIVRFNTRLDTHQDSFRAPSEHRFSDQMANAVMIYADNTFYVNREMYGFYKIYLECPATKIQGMAYFENTIYIRNDKSIVYGYTPSNMKWENITKDERDVETVAMVPIGNELIAVITADKESFAVESLSIKAHRPVKWVQIGELTTLGREVASVTNIGSMLVVFWRQTDENCLGVECFDLIQQTTAILADKLSCTYGLVTFKHDDEAFALSEDGNLWRICGTKTEPYITIKQELSLWDTPRPLGGAMLFRGELAVFVTSEISVEIRQADQKSVCLDKVFKGILFVKSELPQTGYIHTVLNRDIFLQCE